MKLFSLVQDRLMIFKGPRASQTLWAVQALHIVAVMLEKKSLEVSVYASTLQSCSVQINSHRSYQICLELMSNKIILLLVSLFSNPRQAVSCSWQGELIETMKQFLMELALAQVLFPLHIFLASHEISIVSRSVQSNAHNTLSPFLASLKLHIMEILRPTIFHLRL